jgi:hypothetical protein
MGARTIWKIQISDGGVTWTELSQPDANVYDRTTTSLEGAGNLLVDPMDPQHLYATKGVTGNNHGFWVSHDGGKTWIKPAAFPPPGTGSDVMMISSTRATSSISSSARIRTGR